jgi:hypothetical protein
MPSACDGLSAVYETEMAFNGASSTSSTSSSVDGLALVLPHWPLVHQAMFSMIALTAEAHSDAARSSWERHSRSLSAALSAPPPPLSPPPLPLAVISAPSRAEMFTLDMELTARREARRSTARCVRFELCIAPWGWLANTSQSAEVRAIQPWTLGWLYVRPAPATGPCADLSVRVREPRRMPTCLSPACCLVVQTCWHTVHPRQRASTPPLPSRRAPRRLAPRSSAPGLCLALERRHCACVVSTNRSLPTQPLAPDVGSPRTAKLSIGRIDRCDAQPSEWLKNVPIQVEERSGTGRCNFGMRVQPLPLGPSVA